MEAKIIRANVELVTEDGETFEVKLDDARGLHVHQVTGAQGGSTKLTYFCERDGSQLLTITRDKD